MKQSIRRIANALLVVAVLGLSYSFLSSITFNCGLRSEGCIASVFGMIDPPPYESNLALSQSTEMVHLEGIGLLAVIQLMGAYLLLIAVMVLIILECFEFYYLRRLFAQRHAFRMR